MIALVYYNLESMNELVRDGVLPGIPEGNDITLAYLNLGSIQMANAQSETDDSDSWWDDWGSCAFAVTKLVGAGAALTLACSPPAAGATVGASCYLAGVMYVAASASVGIACGD